jgi:hypothetical protein
MYLAGGLRMDFMILRRESNIKALRKEGWRVVENNDRPICLVDFSFINEDAVPSVIIDDIGYVRLYTDTINDIVQKEGHRLGKYFLRFVILPELGEEAFWIHWKHNRGKDLFVVLKSDVFTTGERISASIFYDRMQVGVKNKKIISPQ